MVSPAIQRLLELDKQKDAVKKWHEDLQAALTAVAQEIGVGGFFQDPSTGRVYEVIEPNGRFVYFDKLSYNRTKLPDEESKGTLSIKRAKEAGFDV